MIRKSLLLISIFSLLYGLIFLLAPNFFAEITAAEKTNIAWLRNIGASISGVLFVGLLLVYKSPRKNYDLFLIITITSILTNNWSNFFKVLQRIFSSKNFNYRFYYIFCHFCKCIFSLCINKI